MTVALTGSEAFIERIHESTNRKGAPGLLRMRRLLELLGHPERGLNAIHIAGTNGKGSIAQYMAAILRAGGYSVGVYTSPHVMRYNERYEIDHEEISDDDFVRLGDIVIGHNDKLDEEGFGCMSEFEILTAIAFMYFKEKSPDYTVLEVGLGGRIDMTNTVEDPLISIIAQIGLDHTECLGDTLSKIAGEKAGIIRKGTPVVSESPEEEVRKVISAEAGEKKAPLIDTSAFPYVIKSRGILTCFDAEISGRKYTDLKISLSGEHQVRNAIAAFAAATRMSEDGLAELTEQNIRDGLVNARNIGRFEILHKNPYLIIDGAHNPSGIKAALDTLRSYFDVSQQGKKTLIVFGCFRDKEYENMADLFDIPCDYIATEPDNPRKLPANELADVLRKRGVDCRAISDIQQAYDAAENGGYDIVFFMGSIYLIGDIRKIYKSKGWNDYV